MELYFARNRKDLIIMQTVKYCILYNPFSGNGQGKAHAEKAFNKLGKENCVPPVDMTAINNYNDFFEAHHDENIVICGGDGTLNCFLNETAEIKFDNSLFYFPAGSGNDFYREFNLETEEIVNIDKYVKDLPVCDINGKKFKFINGIGYGIDGYCCEKGDELRKISDKPINYTGIAIKGLLFHYKPTKAKITVDGVTHEFKKVWLAPVMKGKYYGGGMLATPDQDRFDKDGTLSVMIFHTTGKLRTLMIFPSIFKGEHVKNKKAVTILTGKEITVEFSEPRPAQIDGETVLNVKKHTVTSNVKIKEEVNV